MKMRGISYWLVVVLYSVSYTSDICNLYTNHRAMQVDDILTVMIVENAKAGSQSSTNTAKKNSLGIDNLKGKGMLHMIPSFGASGETSTDYDGKGATTRQGNLVAKVSAHVVKVFDNGNLYIKGDKLVEINDEKEVIKISGVVRPQDIEPDNSIYSYHISEAHISYSGKGVTSDAQKPGFFARLFNWLL